MAKTSCIQITPRDRELLESLLRDPKTPDQLLRESVVFEHPFPTRLRLQVRLKQLSDAGLLKRWRYLDNGDGAAPYYYKLSPEGFRLAAGPDAKPPTKRYFSPISPSLQRHQRDLADCNIHTWVAAHRAGINVSDYKPQDSVVLSIGNDRLQPDSTWQLIPTDGAAGLNFFFEIDCSTESLRSSNGRASTLERKVARYEALHYGSTLPFRVVFVFTRSHERLQHFVQLAGQSVRNRQRVIFYGVELATYLATASPLRSAIFLDQNARPVSLIPDTATRRQNLVRPRRQVYSQAPRRQTVAVSSREGTALSLPFPER